mmetsp:Transcript_1917/g.2401  ORF Transcript_1917/g.2401 Transcript_1917/m.2401 type:complete len:325 (-) Transcript_1917:18-992(-)
MDSHSNRLFSEGRMVVAYFLPDFLTAKEIARFSATCRFARKAIKDYESVWRGRLVSLATKYRMKIERDQHEDSKSDLDKFYVIDKTHADAVRNRRMYRVKGTKNVFRMICSDGVVTCAELRGGWAWTNNTTYYSSVTREDTLFTNPIPMLKTVCWYDPRLSMKYVEPGNYKALIRHDLKEHHTMQNKLTLRMSLIVREYETHNQIKKTEVFFTGSFPSKQICEQVSSQPGFVNTHIADINTDNHHKLEDSEYFELYVEWNQNDDWWKGGYTIDGAILVPVDIKNFCTDQIPEQQPETETKHVDESSLIAKMFKKTMNILLGKKK